MDDRDTFDACELLVDAGVDPADCNALLEHCVKKQWKVRLARLLGKGHRLQKVPLCGDPAIVQLLVANGAELDGPEFVDYSLGKNGGCIPEKTSLPLLKYLQDHHGLQVDEQFYGDIALNIMRGNHWGHMREHHMDMLRHLMYGFIYDSNTTFTYRRKGKFERRKVSVIDSGRHRRADRY